MENHHALADYEAFILQVFAIDQSTKAPLFTTFSVWNVDGWHLEHRMQSSNSIGSSFWFCPGTSCTAPWYHFRKENRNKQTIKNKQQTLPLSRVRKHRNPKRHLKLFIKFLTFTTKIKSSCITLGNNLGYCSPRVQKMFSNISDYWEFTIYVYWPQRIHHSATFELLISSTKTLRKT